MTNSTPNQDSCISIYALAGPPRSKKPNQGELIIRVSVSVTTVQNKPATKPSPLIRQTNKTTFQQPRKAFLASTDDQQHQTIYNIIHGLVTPLPLENINWGINLPSDDNPSRPENLHKIISNRLLQKVRFCAANDRIEWMTIHIQKLEKLEPEKYQHLCETKVKEHPLEDWFLDNKGRVKLDPYLYKLGKESPADNKFYGLRSQKMEASELCSICVTNIKKNSQAISMPCSHTFHGSCILQWLQRKPNCPLCRFHLLSSNA